MKHEVFYRKTRIKKSFDKIKIDFSSKTKLKILIYDNL